MVKLEGNDSGRCARGTFAQFLHFPRSYVSLSMLYFWILKEWITAVSKNCRLVQTLYDRLLCIIPLILEHTNRESFLGENRAE